MVTIINRIVNVTAVTESLPYGQCTVAAIVEYERPLPHDCVDADCFEVVGRIIQKAFVSNRGDINASAEEGHYVILLLTPYEEAGMTFVTHGHGPSGWIELKKGEVQVRQVKTLIAADGSVANADEKLHASNTVVNRIVDNFTQGEFEGLPYNLYAPAGCTDGKKYPLLLFIHDAGVCGKNPLYTLTHGIGATIWADERDQEKHPCFVLAPQFAPPPMMRDNFTADERIDLCLRLIHHIVDMYPVDKSRIYTTGQSLGCMASCEMLVREPELFRAALLVAGQWNPATMAKLTDKPMWIIVSEGDKKAFPGMTAVVNALEENGAKATHQSWRANESQNDYLAHVEEMISTGATVLFTSLDKTTVLPEGVEDNPGAQHVNTWPKVYRIDALRDWLFTNS